ncbi:MAG: D-3-phosphoglycerate dehydrogenase [Pseudomonadales bacterium]
MQKIRTFNQISVKGLERLPCDGYEVASDITNPDAIMLRSHKLAVDDITGSVLAIGRAGAGVNNIPLEACTKRGIPVFNAPGANANAVKELVLCAMLLGSRGILEGLDYARALDAGSDAGAMNKLLEKEKNRFKGNELAGRTLGVVGLGAIGSLVAKTALMMGMKVLGYDPALSVDAAWRLPSEVKKMNHLAALFAKSDFVSLHLPVLDSTRGLIDANTLRDFKKDAVLLNFSRAEIVDTASVVDALAAGTIRQYFCDFPHPLTVGVKGVVAMPHIGASTDEAEDNCAIMIAEQLKDFLQNGNITNSVNFPALSLERSGSARLVITNFNVPKMLGSITNILADADLNVVDMLNKSRDDIAYNLIDLDSVPSSDAIEALTKIEGVINVRVI